MTQAPLDVYLDGTARRHKSLITDSHVWQCLDCGRWTFLGPDVLEHVPCEEVPEDAEEEVTA